MGQRITPGEFITPESYFAAYVDRTLTANPGPTRVQHLRDYGHGLLGSSQSADRIVNEWIEQKGQ